MFILIDTSSNSSFIALADKSGKILEHKSWKAGMGSAEKIFVKNKELRIKNKELKGIGVFVGPGSFTGLRVGIAYANALAYAMKIPIAGINDFEITERFIVLKTGYRQPAVILLENIHDLVYARIEKKKRLEYFVGDLTKFKTKNQKPKTGKIFGNSIQENKIKEAKKLFKNFKNIKIGSQKRLEIFAGITVDKFKGKCGDEFAKPLYISSPHITHSKK